MAMIKGLEQKPLYGVAVRLWPGVTPEKLAQECREACEAETCLFDHEFFVCPLRKGNPCRSFDGPACNCVTPEDWAGVLNHYVGECHD